MLTGLISLETFEQSGDQPILGQFGDYRDVLYWAEYYTNDPLLRRRDPKQMVDEIITKWGKKSE